LKRATTREAFAPDALGAHQRCRPYNGFMCRGEIKEEYMLPISWYLIVSAILFTIGVSGVLIRRNPLIIFMSIELMLNAVNLSFIAFSRYLDSVDGQMFVFLVLTVAAAEVVVGLALIVSIFRTRRDIDVDDMNILRG